MSRVAYLFLGMIIVQSVHAEQASDQRHKGYSGFSEITLETGNTRSTDNETTLEQWNEIIYKDLNTGKEIGTQFSFKLGTQGADSSDAEIYQLYLKQAYQDKTLTLGRFEQIDARGFYTLDGLSLKPKNDKQLWFYLGVPKRIDAYSGVDGGFLMGIEKRFSRTFHNTKLLKTGGVSFNNTNNKIQQHFRLGLQQEWADSLGSRTKGSYLNLVFSQLGSPVASLLSPVRLDLSGGLRLDEEKIENLVAKAEFDLKKQGRLYLSYDHYRPPELNISFRDRFYESYASKTQDVLRADWHKKLNQETTLNLQAKQVWHEQGSNGQGMTLGLHFQPRKYDWKTELRTDLVQLEDDRSLTFYANFKKPLSSVITLELEGMAQQKETMLTGKDKAQGIAFRLKRLLKKGLQIETYGEYIHQSDRDNEYQFGIRLRKDFFDLPWKGMGRDAL